MARARLFENLISKHLMNYLFENKNEGVTPRNYFPKLRHAVEVTPLYEAR